jgi:hypothetical protein
MGCSPGSHPARCCRDVSTPRHLRRLARRPLHPVYDDTTVFTVNLIGGGFVDMRSIRPDAAERSVRAECGECHSLPAGLGLRGKNMTACRTTLKDKLIKVDANVVSHDRCVVGGRRCHPEEPISRHLQADRGTARGYPMCDIILVDDVTRSRPVPLRRRG